MSTALLDELLADYVAPGAAVFPAATPAKAANSANREHPRGPAPVFVPCEALRMSANVESRTPGAEADSQKFAAVRKPQTTPRSEQTCGSSQNSQDSQGGRADAQARPYRLTPEQGDRCHAGGWDDGEIAAFTARQARALRAGFGNDDADDLAERLTLRDREGDERVLCAAECANHRVGNCTRHRIAGVGRELGSIATTLNRCPAFTSVEK